VCHFHTNPPRAVPTVSAHRARTASVRWPDRAGILSPVSSEAPTSNNWSTALMSSIVFDYLLPLVGPEQAAYWAQVFLIDPA